VGVFFEFAIIAHEYREELECWRRGIITPPNRPSRKWLFIDLFGVLLVSVGLAGEFIVDVKAGGVETQIRDANARLTVLLENEAGDAKKSADAAATSASTALGLANTAGTKAADAETTAGNASTTASTASESAKAVGLKAAELTAQLTTTSKELEAVEAKRKALEAALTDLAICTAPRVIPFWLANGTSYFAPLLPLAGQIASIEYIPYDAEARRAALNLARALNDAGWAVQLPPKPVDGLEDGVYVQPFPHRPDGSNNNLRAKADYAADGLIDFLHSYNWAAAQSPAVVRPDSMPDGAIRIQIGLYPPAVNSALPGEAALNDSEKRFQAARKKQLEDHINTFPPEQREQLRKFHEGEDAKMKSMNGPCKVLNSTM
jgi:hypothetical protein